MPLTAQRFLVLIRLGTFLCGIGMFSLHLCGFFSRYADFSPQSKDMHVRLIGSSVRLQPTGSFSRLERAPAPGQLGEPPSASVPCKNKVVRDKVVYVVGKNRCPLPCGMISAIYSLLVLCKTNAEHTHTHTKEGIASNLPTNAALPRRCGRGRLKGLEEDPSASVTSL